MYRIIGGDQKEYGPVSADDLRRWIAEGRLNGPSLVQAEGSGEWQPLAAFAEFTDALRLQAGPASAAVAGAPPTRGAAWREEVLARRPEVRIGECLGQSWRLLTANFGLLFGATAVVWVITLGCQFIPLVGGIVNWLLQGVLLGGVYLVFLNRIRGQPASVGDAFTGFSVGFAQLMLTGLLTRLLGMLGLVCCLVLPGIYLLVAWTFSVPLVADKRLEFWSAMELSRKVVTRVWFEVLGLLIVAFLPVILANVFVQIRLALTIFPAMQDLMTGGPPDFRHMMEVMMQVVRASIPLAMLLKFVLLLNLPFGLGALMYAYEGLFGTRPAPAT
jgi:uncharacterized membrane protein